ASRAHEGTQGDHDISRVAHSKVDRVSKRRKELWLALIVLAVILPIVVVVSVVHYMSATSTRLHPNPQDVTSVAQSPPSPKWTSAVEQARHIARAGLSEENVPGMSVAVGVGQDIVWAEGFGWADLDSRAPVTPGTRFRIGHASKVLTSAA